MITNRWDMGPRLPIPRRAGSRPAGAGHYSSMVVPRSVLSRATDAVANRLDRRSFIARSALVGSALVTAPTDLLLRPTSAYAAVCSCQGQSCTCGSLCCDGYTEFCCAIYGANACPSGSLTGGWWKADGSSFCGGAVHVTTRHWMGPMQACWLLQLP